VFLKHHPVTFQVPTQKAEKVGIVAFGVIETGEYPKTALTTLNGTAKDDLTTLDQVCVSPENGSFIWQRPSPIPSRNALNPK